MTKGVYESWKSPGCREEEGLPTATKAKLWRASIYIGSSVRGFRIHYLHSHDDFPWQLSENWPVGEREAVDNYLLLSEFSSMREAVKEARRLTSESVIAGPGKNTGLTLKQKKAKVRSFVRSMLPYLESRACMLRDEADDYDVKELVSEGFAPYLNPPVVKRGKEVIRVRGAARDID